MPVFSCPLLPRLGLGVLWASEATRHRNALGITRISMGLCDTVSLQSTLRAPSALEAVHALPWGWACARSRRSCTPHGMSTCQHQTSWEVLGLAVQGLVRVEEGDKRRETRGRPEEGDQRRETRGRPAVKDFTVYVESVLDCLWS